jgi:K+-sensing histidine kinase KdpD
VTPTTTVCKVVHVPDYLLRDADGVGIVVDIRPEALIDAQDRLCFAGTAALCR